VLEVKGDFCGKVKEILLKRVRAGDFIEIGLDSEWACNPLYNDLEGYALAYLKRPSLLVPPLRLISYCRLLPPREIAKSF